MFEVCLTFFDEVDYFTGSYVQKIFEYETVEEAREARDYYENLYKDNGLVSVSSDC